MRLLFVENRYTTWLYAAVAKSLQADGHEIHWLVQNHRFIPDFGHAHRLPYPTRSELRPGLEAYAWLRRTDRGLLHFGGTDAHYAAYDRAIAQALASAAPDVAFGEATQFHELLAVSRCKALGLPYLSPSATRYPPGRMAFLAYDTMNPVGGCGELLDPDEALTAVRAVAARKVVPSYMRPPDPKPWQDRLRRRAEAVRILAGWAGGERYITPSPLRKWRLERAQAQAVARWEAQATSVLPEDLPEKRWVLYPLQMQPEANLDVWGQPWNDQADLIRRAAEALARVGAWLVVKPNPKSKYEMDARLCEAVAAAPNMVALSHAVPMAAIYPAVPMVLTVTGTIQLECLFSGKPVAVLGDHAMARHPGARRLASPEDLADAMEEVAAGTVLRASEAEAVELYQHLHCTSYPAECFDPLAHPEKLDAIRLRPLVEAFRHVIQKTQTSWSGLAPAPFSAG